MKIEIISLGYNRFFERNIIAYLKIKRMRIFYKIGENLYKIRSLRNIVVIFHYYNITCVDFYYILTDKNIYMFRFSVHSLYAMELGDFCPFVGRKIQRKKQKKQTQPQNIKFTNVSH